MRNWFPFTDYDFYAYLTSGILTLAVVDEAVFGGAWIGQEKWSLAEGVLLIASSYVCGHVVASLSSLTLEHWVARSILHPPASLILGVEAKRKRERIVSFLVGRRGYSKISDSLLANTFSRVKKSTGEDVQETSDFESAFQVGYSLTRADEDARKRVDDFRNQYGFCRNVAFVSWFAAAIFFGAYLVDQNSPHLAFAAIAVFFGFMLTVRFLKFYGAFALEVLRPTWGAPKP